MSGKNIARLGALLFVFIAVFSVRPATSAPPGDFFPEDVITITGKDLPASVMGAPVSAINVLSVRDGKLVPVPFQIDEIRDGEIVFQSVTPLGAEKGLYTEDKDKGKLDNDDLLLIMSRDLGPKTPAFGEMDSRPLVEIEVRGPGAVAYAYLTTDGKTPRSRVDYVSQKFGNGRMTIETGRYRFSLFDTKGYFDTFQLKKPDGTWTENLVVRNQMPAKMTLRLIGLSGEMDFYNLIEGETIAVKDGLIRAIWRCVGGADFGVFKIKGEGGTEQHFYLNRMDHPVTMDIPFDFNSVLSSFEARGTILFPGSGDAPAYFDVSNRKGVVLDGKPESGRETLVGPDRRTWCAFQFKDYTVYFLALFPQAWEKTLNPVSYIHESDDKIEAGTIFGEMVDLLKGGINEYSLRYYIVPGRFQWGGELVVPEIAGRKTSVRASLVAISN